MKHCYACKTDKPLSDFYKNSSKTDGLSPACKECHKAWRHDHYRRNAEAVGISNRRWEKLNPEVHKAYVRKFQKDKYHANKHTGIFGVYHLVKRAIKHGILTPEPCRICKDVNVVAHHEDYSRPLDVLWYCRRHHSRLHDITGSRMHTLPIAETTQRADAQEKT